MDITLDGVVVRHTSRPLESLYERSLFLFASFVMLCTVLWVMIATVFPMPFWVAAIGTVLVLLGAASTPYWLEVRKYAIEGSRRIIIDERGLQIEGILIPWSELHFRRHGERDSSVSLWDVGPETIIVTFEHENHRFSAFLGVRFKPLAPIVHAETLTKRLSESEALKLQALISEHLERPSQVSAGLRELIENT